MPDPAGTFRLVVSLDFSASHQLRHYQGKCENMHGHNFTVEAAVEGETLRPDLGILMDFKDLKAELRAVLAELDHRHLNDLEPFLVHNPSSEHIARHIYEQLFCRLERFSVRLASVAVSEKPGQTAVYLGPPASAR